MVSTPLLHCILHWTSLWQRPTTEWTGSNSVTSARASHYRCLHISPIIPPDIGKPKIRAMQRLNNVNITMTDIRMKLSVVILKKKKTRICRWSYLFVLIRDEDEEEEAGVSGWRWMLLSLSHDAVPNVLIHFSPCSHTSAAPSTIVAPRKERD